MVTDRTLVSHDIKEICNFKTPDKLEALNIPLRGWCSLRKGVTKDTSNQKLIEKTFKIPKKFFKILFLIFFFHATKNLFIHYLFQFDNIIMAFIRANAANNQYKMYNL